MLLIWTITDHPLDYPDNYAVRAQIVTKDGEIKSDSQVFLFDELPAARLFLEEKGLHCLGRHPDDDPVIVEAWI